MPQRDPWTDLHEIVQSNVLDTAINCAKFLDDQFSDFVRRAGAENGTAQNTRYCATERLLVKRNTGVSFKKFLLMK